jgi:hypothetical protein
VERGRRAIQADHKAKGKDSYSAYALAREESSRAAATRAGTCRPSHMIRAPRAMIIMRGLGLMGHPGAEVGPCACPCGAARWRNGKMGDEGLLPPQGGVQRLALIVPPVSAPQVESHLPSRRGRTPRT